MLKIKVEPAKDHRERSLGFMNLHITSSDGMHHIWSIDEGESLETTISLPYMMDELGAELLRQNIKWGEQNHPLVGGNALRLAMDVAYKRRADTWKHQNDTDAQNGDIGWDGILLEEVYEALSEPDEDKQVEELIQVAAVALQAAASIMRNRKP